MIYAFLITKNYKYKYCFLSFYGVWIYLPSKKSHLDLVNGHFSTQLSAHGPSFAKNVLTGKGVEHRRSKPFVLSLSPQLCPFKSVELPSSVPSFYIFYMPSFLEVLRKFFSQRNFPHMVDFSIFEDFRFSKIFDFRKFSKE